MKFFLLILFLLFKVVLCNAQSVTYNELKYVFNHNLGQVEEYLSSKGFDYAGVDTAGVNQNIYSYNFVKRNKTYFKEITITKGFEDGKAFSASFETYIKNDYLTFKDYIKKIGYAPVGNLTMDNGSLLIQYAKDNIMVTFTLSVLSSNRNYYLINLFEK